MLALNMIAMPFFISFGKGNFPFQLISVQDVASYFVESINNDKTFNKTFCLCGNEIYTFKEIVVLIKNMMQLKRVIIPFPISLIKIITKMLGYLDSFPITYDQLLMLLKGNVCDDNSIEDVIKIKKISLIEKIADILKEV
jgi:NADH dehydrogenase